ncbi:MAG: hypothetical protein JWQ27_1283 [Ferruginibacter sp.]|nr:hypothetical protein [Ferruginibacter sp.]
MEQLRKLAFEVNFEQPLKEDLVLAGFLFHCNGYLLQQQLVRKNVLEFDLSNFTHKEKETEQRSLDSKQLRVLIAPVTEKIMKGIRTLEDLEKLKPYEPVLRKNSDGMFSILPIPIQISQHWPRCHCRVTGKVSKWFLTGSTWENRAICRARVHICDVDSIRYWIYKIPDRIIARIPDAILHPKEIVRFPIPVPDPPPFLRNAILPSAPIAANLFKKSSPDEKLMGHAATLPELPLELRQTLVSRNLDHIREAIISNYAVLHPWFCLWPWWWPYFYQLQELAVDYTDANGRFDANVSYQCFRDRPDIYIWIDYMINGAWQIIYQPPVPCNVRWDYQCGTPINIQVTDPRVPGNCCCDCHIPGDAVWIRSVGAVSVSHILQNTLMAAPPGQSVPYQRQGLTDASAAYDPGFYTAINNDYRRPFGGSPSLYMGFGSSLPNNNIYYYRWSYRQLQNADLDPVADFFKPLEPAGVIINKGYQYEYTDVNGDTQFAPGSVTLGPVPVGGNNLYIIPPEHPDMAPFNVPEFSPDWHEPTDMMLTMSFDSTSLKRGTIPGGDGMYEFRLELFDQAGNLLTNLPRSVYKSPDHNNSGYSVNAPDDLLDLGPGATARAFSMKMRIDNGQCQGEVFTVNVNGAPASLDCCGFAAYKPGGVEADLSLTFLATHPHNFAVFSFGVEKGTCGGVPNAGASGQVIDDAGGYTLTAGVYEKHFTPQQLLDQCYNNGTGKAAFAETLHIAAIATDGYNRLTGKDAGDVAAFALEP